MTDNGITSLTTLPPIAIDTIVNSKDLVTIEHILALFADGKITISDDEARYLAKNSLRIVDNLVEACNHAEANEEILLGRIKKLQSEKKRQATASKTIRRILTEASLRSDNKWLSGNTHLVTRVDTPGIKKISDPDAHHHIRYPDLVITHLTWSQAEPTPETYLRLVNAGLEDLVRTRYEWDEDKVEKRIKGGNQDLKQWFAQNDEHHVAFGVNNKVIQKSVPITEGKK